MVARRFLSPSHIPDNVTILPWSQGHSHSIRFLLYILKNCSTPRYEGLPEFPTAMEPRMYTRWDMHKYARDAYELGVRYIGGCCGVEPHHIREAIQSNKFWLEFQVVKRLEIPF